jgi:hypothetical protein
MQLDQLGCSADPRVGLDSLSYRFCALRRSHIVKRRAIKPFSIAPDATGGMTTCPSTHLGRIVRPIRGVNVILYDCIVYSYSEGLRSRVAAIEAHHIDDHELKRSSDPDGAELSDIAGGTHLRRRLSSVLLVN